MGARQCRPVRRDRDFVAIAGCSAGGHLAALTGLTHDDADFHVDLAEGADTSVDAVVGIYGRYDWVDRSTPERDRFVDFLERVVVKKRLAKHPELFRKASPIARVRPDAPPFLVVHGSGFDMTDGSRTQSAATVIGLFLNEIHRGHLKIRAKEVI